jgi:hypothetical protein
MDEINFFLCLPNHVMWWMCEMLNPNQRTVAAANITHLDYQTGMEIVLSLTIKETFAT